MAQATEVMQYVRTGRLGVPGWFELEDARTFVLADEVQQAAGTRGDLLEIGAYLGQSAILLGMLARDDETVIVSDLFGADPDEPTPDVAEDLEPYASLDLDAFRANWSRHHDTDPVVIVGPSRALHDRTWDHPLRIIHVDGGHTYECVRDDLDLALKLASPGQLIVIDDIRRPHTPGVAAAAWESVADHGLIPIAMSEKLYVSPDADFADALVQRLRTSDLDTREHRIMGRPMLQVHPAPTTSQRIGQFVPPILRPTLKKLQGDLRTRLRR